MGKHEEHFILIMFYMMVNKTKLCSTETCRLFFFTRANPTCLAILEILADGSKNVAQI
jgi:hypothetical protein